MPILGEESRKLKLTIAKLDMKREADFSLIRSPTLDGIDPDVTGQC
jgi:hypothetical protein